MHRMSRIAGLLNCWSFHKRATHYRALLRKLTYTDNDLNGSLLGGEDAQDVLNCLSFESLVFLLKRATHYRTLLRKTIYTDNDLNGWSFCPKEPLITGLFCAKEPLIVGLFCGK